MNRVLMITLPFATRPHPTDPNSVVVDLSGSGDLPLPEVSVEVSGLEHMPDADRERILTDAQAAAEEEVIPHWVRHYMKAKIVADPYAVDNGPHDAALRKPSRPSWDSTKL